jgi:hypothetical protein
MAKYRTKPVVIEAVQYEKNGQFGVKEILMTHQEWLRFKKEGELLRLRTKLFLESLENELTTKESNQ